MALRVAPVSLAAVRARKHDRRTEAEELRMELRAAGSEMVAMSLRLTAAIEADDLFSAHHFAKRLGYLGQGYITRSPEPAA